ncbi:hypothetical protein B0H19DRAFT_1082557 [Mycena capillaripes]|nr:hypothetical protein B0H19DRAFT_1082557 [Mycena capillaripes]
MVILRTTQMAVNIAVTAIYAQLLQQVVHSQVDPQLVASLDMLNVLEDLSFVLNMWILALSMLRDLEVPKKDVVRILASTPGGSITDPRIPCSLGAATNLLLTAFTELPRADMVALPAGRILWTRCVASHVGLDKGSGRVPPAF